MAVNPQTAPTRDPIIEADPDVCTVSGKGRMQVVADNPSSSTMRRIQASEMICRLSAIPFSVSTHLTAHDAAQSILHH